MAAALHDANRTCILNVGAPLSVHELGSGDWPDWGMSARRTILRYSKNDYL
ncbi:MAG TPA: hypothetical protein VL069_13345 [Opitutus sp.]|nr:hypothetical protein [Opitutus sp.]